MSAVLAAAGPAQQRRGSRAVLEVTGVSKSYVMGTQPFRALNDVTLTIGTGEFVALTGPSGSGKSTLLNLCGLIDRPDSGSLTVAGRETAGLDEDALTLLRRESVGFIFQSFNLVPVMTVFENVEFPLLLQGVEAGRRAGRVREILDRVGLAGFEKRRPDELSGGQRQRVAIARALVKSSRLVIADEPTANLDSVTTAQVTDLMRALGRDEGTTCVIATHDPRVADHCDRVFRLVDGVLQ
ncbi:MAG: ABC transporter ATP-binding protein [Betaproteobacteria bacterium]|nr:ABC transporter ATP-binding protein [Betaproteobacteria bacterium]